MSLDPQPYLDAIENHLPRLLTPPEHASSDKSGLMRYHKGRADEARAGACLSIRAAAVAGGGVHEVDAVVERVDQALDREVIIVGQAHGPEHEV